MDVLHIHEVIVVLGSDCMMVLPGGLVVMHQVTLHVVNE